MIKRENKAILIPMFYCANVSSILARQRSNAGWIFSSGFIKPAPPSSLFGRYRVLIYTWAIE
jgi:hypothetical protein